MASFIMYASNSHSYTHLILALGIVRERISWVFITSRYPGIHDTGLPSNANGTVVLMWLWCALETEIPPGLCYYWNALVYFF